MSEYQYYEFQTIDRPLSEASLTYLRSLSSRVELTPTQAIFTYSYADFRGDPLKVLADHFDAMLYLANWGTTRLAFRFPRAAVDVDRLQPYRVPYGIELTTTPEYVVLDIEISEEDPRGWIEGEGILSRLTPLRGDILRGDLRVLYLAWLKAAQFSEGEWIGEQDGEEDGQDDDAEDDGEEDEAEDGDGPDGAVDGPGGGEEIGRRVEPPVPPGLGELTAPLRAFVELFELDVDLVAAAAEASPPLAAAEAQVEPWLQLLPEAERLDFLARVLRGEPLVDVQLRRRLRELAGHPGTAGPAPGGRTLAELLDRATEHRRRREAREQAERERERQRRLQELAGREDETWAEVDRLIAQMQGRPYDEAVALLTQLGELAAQRGQRAQFELRMRAYQAEYPTRHGLLSRMRQAGLLPGRR